MDIINNAAMHIGIQATLLFSTFDFGGYIYIGVKLFGRMVILCTFLGTAKIFSIVAVPFYIDIGRNAMSNFSALT